jgi:hypothetical protein
LNGDDKEEEEAVKEANEMKIQKEIKKKLFL